MSLFVFGLWTPCRTCWTHMARICWRYLLVVGENVLVPYIKHFWRGFRGTSLADRRVGLWPTSWKWRSRRLTFHTGDRWRRTIPTTDKLFCTNTETVSGRVQNGRPGKTTAGGDKHQGSAFLRSYLPLMLRTSHFTKQFICSISIATYCVWKQVLYRVFLFTVLP